MASLRLIATSFFTSAFNVVCHLRCDHIVEHTRCFCWTSRGFAKE